jgi:dipeptidyl aminopeptidase/acylaminoacyl peptidase
LAVADSGTVPEFVGGTDRRWAWIAVLFGAWILSGVYLVVRALTGEVIRDVGISPYHALVYSGLIALAGLSIWLVVRARRRGRGWREAFPPGYGSLGAGLVVFVAGLLLDVAWREGVGIAFGIENGFAPSRVLIGVGLSLVAMAPLRASLLAGGNPAIRWPATLSAGLLATSMLAATGFSIFGTPRLEKPADVPEDNGEIWVMDADGRHQTRLIEAVEGVNLQNPVWSPDGSRIAFVRVAAPSDDPMTADDDIWVANADGSDAHPFATGPSWQWFPRWSPDGAWIEYTDEAVGGPWISSGPVGPDVGQGPQGPVFPGANAADLPEAELMRRAVDGSGPPVRITNVAGDDRSGSWSPDGRWIAFDSTRDGNTEIYKVRVDGQDSTRLTDNPAEDWSAAWSPDGSRIAFSSVRSGPVGQIWVMRTDGTGARQLTNDPEGAQWPAWSPDGTRILFTSWREGQQAWSMAADGSDLKNLSRSPTTTDGTWDGSWGPDGRILFVRSGPPPIDLQPIAREDLGVAMMLISALAVALVIGLLVKTGPPFGGIAVATGIVATLASSATDEWRFIPAAAVAGLVVDVVLRLVPARWRVMVGASGAAIAVVAAIVVGVALTSGLGWSPTLVIGTATAAGVSGWGIGALLERHAFGGPSEPQPAGP